MPDSNAPSILFVSHEATRTGAPTELLHFLRWFKKNGNRPFSILLDRGGELTADFEGLADTWRMDISRWRPEALRTNLLTYAGFGGLTHYREARKARRFAARYSPGLVYANSIASARAIEVLAPHVPVLTHVHELDFVLRAMSCRALDSLFRQTRQFIACSTAVGENLVRNHNVGSTRIETVHEAIPVQEVRAARTREQVLAELKLAEGSLLVAAGGSVSWLKGPDLFIQLARVVCRQRSRVRFVWVGGGSIWDIAQCEHDIRLAGLTDMVRVTGAVQNPVDYLAVAEVFVLTSRQDSYPLMCLEAAALGKPVICFADAGGEPEFVEGDCGAVVPYLDIQAMAESVITLLDSPECRLMMGRNAQRKVAERHDISIAGPRIAEIIERTIAGG